MCDKEDLKCLREELEDLKNRLPEHCYGTEGYIDVHRASPELWQKIEDLEGRIEQLQEAAGR